MIKVQLNSRTTLIIHSDKSISLMQDAFYRDAYDDEIALPPAAVLELKQYLNTYIPEEE